MTDALPHSSRAQVSIAAKTSRPSGNALIASTRQKGNPVLEHVKSTPWEYGDIVADYQVGATTGVLYLSLKYHHLHPQYVFNRFEKLGRSYDLRVLLVLCDVSEHQNSIRELTKASLLNGITVIVAWSPEEAGNYLQTFKAFEFKSHQLIKERVDADYNSVLRSALTTVRGMNKTDVMTLRTNFGSFKNISHASTEDLQLCPGFGPTKVRRLREAFNKPFHSSGQKPLGVPARSPADSANPHELRETEGGPGSAIPPGSFRNSQDAPLAPPHPIPRHSSPDWDIDLQVPDIRPELDIGLDLELNPSDDEAAS